MTAQAASTYVPPALPVRCWGHRCNATIYLDGHIYVNANGTPHTCARP
jgi:hypothetical protein